MDHSDLDCKKTTHCNSRAFSLKGKGADQIGQCYSRVFFLKRKTRRLKVITRNCVLPLIAVLGVH